MKEVWIFGLVIRDDTLIIYMILNPKHTEDIKCSLKLKNGFIDYKKSVHYLGVIITDSGIIRNDIKLFLNEKRCNISVKFLNFCLRNISAPLQIKLRVLEACVTTSLTYACQTWGCIPNDIDIFLRHGLKIALGIRECTNNEIVYLEIKLKE